MTYYISFYDKIPCKGTMVDARKMAWKLLRDENYGEMEVPIYKTKSAKYGNFVGIAYMGATMSDTNTYYDDRSGRYQLYRNGSLKRLGKSRMF